MTSTLQRLCDWFAAQSDGDWEHGTGIRIESLDNPGWRVQIDLSGTSLEAAPYVEYRDSYDDDTAWLLCRRIGNSFEAACGVPRLDDALQRFLDWADSVGSRG